MSERVELPDSARTVPEGAQNQGALEGGVQVSVTVYVRRNRDAKPPFDVADEARKPPGERRYLTADEAREVYGATTADIDAVRAFAASLGLDVVGVNPAARSIKLSGTADAVGRAFGVKLNRYSHGNVPYRSYEGPVSVPPELASVVEAVIGLENRPLGRKHLRRAPTDFAISVEDLAAEAKPPALPANNYYPPQVAALYDFPSQSASGETVAVLAFNGMPNAQGDPQPGGYQSAVLQSYFTMLGLTMPQITNVTVEGKGNDPGLGNDPADSSDEVYLDLSIVGSLATGAKIVVYFSEFNEQGWTRAISEATTDTTNDPLVISISYGSPEDGSYNAWTAWSTAAIHQVNQALEAAAAKGLSITVASGDDGASDGFSDGAVHVNFPASSQWLTGVGGTSLKSTGTTITSEVVWNDEVGDATGGGVSRVFGLPTYQAKANVPTVLTNPKKGSKGRGVPDVSANADPDTGFAVPSPFQGTIGLSRGIGGTSASAPLWAALLARYNAALGERVGFLNPVLYALPAGTLRNITSGNNAIPSDNNGTPGYTAGKGWNACTGWGSPGATPLLNALKSRPPTATSTPTSTPTP